jgi:5-hydroxyisourate hydrolase-like protein (transthyretin family)
MTVSVRLLDLGHGSPVADVQLRVEMRVEDSWHTVATQRTDNDGRGELLTGGRRVRGVYRLVCETDPYYLGFGMQPSYPEVVVPFRLLDDATHGQFIISLAAAGYTIYVGH